MEIMDVAKRCFLLSLGLMFLGRGVISQLDQSSCENVRDFYQSFQFSPVVDLPENPISGAGLKVCQRDQTCCTRRMEERLQQQALDDFTNAILTNVDYLEYFLSSNTDHLKAQYEELLLYGEAKVKQNFHMMYGEFLQMDSDIRYLFEDLKAHVTNAEVKIQRSVRNFFDELFPLLYSQMKPRVSRLTPLFSNCLSANRATIEPFGEVPRKVATLLYNSAESARIILHSLEQGRHVLNSTINMVLGKRCTRSLLEMNYCGACIGRTDAKPCRSYCLNVVKGCLANFMDLDEPWNQYVTAMIDVIRHSMMKNNDLQNAVKTLEYLFNDAVIYAMENEDAITLEVTHKCGYPQRGRPNPYTDFAAANSDTDFPMVPDPSILLDETLFEFVENLDRSRVVYRNLPGMMCIENELGSSTNDECWTGHSVGEYTINPVDNGLDAQSSNPEVSWTGREFELLQAFTLMDKLEDVAHIIRIKIQGKHMEDQDSEMSGSGSGSGCYGDDEDCFSGSGSSSSSRTAEVKDTTIVYTTTRDRTQETTTDEETDFIFDASTQKTTVIHQRGSGGVKPTTTIPRTASTTSSTSSWPFVPDNDKTTPKKVAASGKPGDQTGEEEEGNTDSGAVTCHFSFAMLLFCFLAAWMSHLHL